MRPKSMILILIALGCGLIASIGISQVVERGSGTEQVEVKTSPIYVAMSDIDIGEELNAHRVKLEEWPVDRIPPGAVTAPEQLENQAPVQRLFEGEPIMMGKLAAKDSLITPANRIKPGFRVISVKVQVETAVSHLIRPGDHVDVLATVTSRGGIPRTELVLSNVEVFAINDVMRRGPEQDGSIQAKTVSLQVLPDQASRLVYYSEQSRLTLVLRSPDENNETSATYDAMPTATPEPPVVEVKPEVKPAVDPNLPKMHVLDGSGNAALWVFGEDGELPRQVGPEAEKSEATKPTAPLPPFGTEGGGLTPGGPAGPLGGEAGVDLPPGVGPPVKPTPTELNYGLEF